MKKLFLILSVFFTILAAKADIMPSYSNCVSNWGIGVYFAPRFVTIYEAPDINSKTIDTFSFNEKGILNSSANLTAQKAFVAYIPEKEKALFIVSEESEEWVKVIYNHFTGDSGWLRKDKTKRYYGWREFFYYFGKKNGLYTFKDINPEGKRLFGAPTDEAQVVDSFEIERFISLSLIKGNWMLVKVWDINKEEKIGWLKYRSPGGKLFVFPYL